MKHKIKEWARRYLLAESIGVILGISCAWFVFIFTQNRILAAFVGAWTENVGYYGFIMLREVRLKKKQHKEQNKKYGFASFFKMLFHLFVEFGPAEYLDSFVIRPFYLYFFPFFISNFAVALFVGQMAANVTFYIPTIFSYEMKKKWLKE